MTYQQTLILIKPHAVKEGWTNAIFNRYREERLIIGDMHVLSMTPVQAAEFYRDHEARPYFPGLVEAMCEGPIVAMVWVGDDAITRVRALHGATNPDNAAPGTLRADFKGPGGPRNTVHGSDTPEAVKRECAIIFGE